MSQSTGSGGGSARGEEQRSRGRGEQEVTRPHAGSRDRHRIHMVLEQLARRERLAGAIYAPREGGFGRLRVTFKLPPTSQVTTMRIDTEATETEAQLLARETTLHDESETIAVKTVLIRVTRLRSVNNHWQSKKATRLLAASKNSFHETDTAFTWC